MSIPFGFDWQAYLNLNTDVAKAYSQKLFAVFHYLLFGRNEGRSYVAPVQDDDEKILLVVQSFETGGCQVFLSNILSTLYHYKFVVMRPHGNFVKITYSGTSHWASLSDHEAIKGILNKLNVVAVQISNITTYPLDSILDLFEKLTLPYMVNLHDYRLITEDYLADRPWKRLPQHDRVKEFLMKADGVIAASESAKKYHEEAYPEVKFGVIPHELVRYTDRRHDSRKLEQLKIGIVGHIVGYKGSARVQELLRIIKVRRLPIHIFVFGTIDIRASENITVTGAYSDPEQLQERLARFNPDIFWVPGLINETYCYTLTQMQAHGKPIFCPDLPIYKERSAEYKGTFFHSIETSLDSIADWFLKFMESIPEIVSQADIVEKVHPSYNEFYASVLSEQPVRTKLSEHDSFVFKDEQGKAINHLMEERSEQLDAYLFIPRDATVLELGARYGTVSCIINRVLNNPEAHLAVEPDLDVTSALTDNRNRTGCKFKIWPGAISNSPLQISLCGYRSMTLPTEGPGNIQVVSLSQAEQKFGLKFDTLVADCEGSIGKFLDDYDVSSFRVIILEKDMPQHCDYQKVDEILKDKGFIVIKEELNVVYRTVYANTTSLGYKILNHSVGYGHLGLFGCRGYDTKKGTDAPPNAISAHAPSQIVLETSRKFTLQGQVLPSAGRPTDLLFSCDDEIIGTREITVDPGVHTLKIEGSKEWAHSVWLLNAVAD